MVTLAPGKRDGIAKRQKRDGLGGLGRSLPSEVRAPEPPHIDCFFCNQRVLYSLVYCFPKLLVTTDVKILRKVADITIVKCTVTSHFPTPSSFGLADPNY